MKKCLRSGSITGIVGAVIERPSACTGGALVLKKSVREAMERLRAWLHLTRSERKILEEHAKQKDKGVLAIEDLPSREELDQRAARFPPSYWKLFRSTPQEDTRLFSGRDHERETFTAIVEGWRQGARPLVAVIGPDVCGKSSLLNQFQGDLKESVQVRRITVEKRVRTEQQVLKFFSHSLGIGETPRTLDDLIRNLLSLPRQVVMVDDAHYLFLRSVGLSSVLQSFLALLMETQKQLLWVISFGEYAWRRLDYQFKIARYFSDALMIPFFKEEDVKKMIALRQELSGLAVAYREEEDDSPPSGEPKQEPEPTPEERQAKQEALADRYFRELFLISRGNMHAALLYWLLDATFDDQKKVIEIRPSRAADLRFVQEMDNLHLFTLAEVLAHGGLTAGEHGEIFQLPASESRVILDYLGRRRLIEPIEGGPMEAGTVYRVNTVFHTKLAAILEGGHFLY